MKITTTLLKKGASNGLTLFDIASMLCRDLSIDDKKSDLEIMYEKAKKILENQLDDNNNNDDEKFYTILFSIMDEEILKKKKI